MATLQDLFALLQAFDLALVELVTGELTWMALCTRVLATFVATTSRDVFPTIGILYVRSLPMVIASDWQAIVDTLAALKYINHLSPCTVCLCILFSHECLGIAEDIHSASRSAGGHDCPILIPSKAWAGGSN